MMIIKEYPHSKALRRMAYDAVTRNFYVEFLSGDIWRYPEVSQHWAERIFADASQRGAGESYQYNVKGRLAGEKVSSFPPDYPTHRLLAERRDAANVALDIIHKLWDRGWRPNPEMGLFTHDEWAAHAVDISVEALREERDSMVAAALKGEA